jgi:ABC-type transporter Mla subunit MlaD
MVALWLANDEERRGSMTVASIVLIVNGVILRDDPGMVSSLLDRLRGIMEQVDQLGQIVSDLASSVGELVSDITTLLQQPMPDIAGAVNALQALKQQVDDADAAIEAVIHPTP